MRQINTNEPWIDDREVEAVAAVLKSGRLTSPAFDGGPKVQEFERQLKEITRSTDAIAVSSGTTALSAALMALGIGPGDEVIVPPITFGATAATVLMQGATPVFADISLDDFTIDPADVARKVTPRTKAVIAVDLFGVPADFEALRKAVGKDILLIEDAAQSLGAEHHGRFAGNLADIGTISFYPGKVVTTGEGGACITGNPGWAKAMRAIRSGGMTAPYHYEYLGSNFRLSELHAAIGVEQLKKLPEIVRRRRENARFFNECLKAYPFLRVPDFLGDRKSNFYIYTVLMTAHTQRRDEIIARMKEKGVDCRAYYTSPVHKTPLYAAKGYGDAHLPNAEIFAKSTFSLPVHPKLAHEDLKYIFDSLKEILEEMRERI